MKYALQHNRALLTVLALVGLCLGIIATTMEAQVWVPILLSGLTLGALYFLVAAGLSLIFGLMDVVNFAHGTIFMIGAYVGYTFFTEPTDFWGGAALALAAVGGWLGGTLLQRRFARFMRGGWVRQTSIALLGALLLGGILFSGIPLVAPATLIGVCLGAALLSAGLSGGSLEAGPASASRLLDGRLAIALLLGALLISTFHQPLSDWVLTTSTNWRFLLALLAGALSGGLLGAAIEVGLIRPFYSRPEAQVLLTLGLVFIGDELVKSIWGPTGFPMDRPELFDGRCRADSVAMWLTEHCASINILGRAFATYRLFIMLLGLTLLISVGLLLRYSRIGMIIRAGVQDRQMVEALGINVQAMFTLVFAAGAALSALGGVAAAPFIGLSPTMGLEYQLQAFIVVVLGGMGSYPGAALGAVLVGLARAFGDHFVLSGIALPGMAEATRLSPAIARASTVLVMAIFLLVRPAGIFGKRQ